MCNINIVINLKEKNSLNLLNLNSFLNGVTTLSFDNNSDGDGFYCDRGLIVKSNNKINYSKYFEEISKSNFIISHQRKATSGFKKKFTHPFKSDDFVLVHNGVLRHYIREGKSDTSVMFEEFIKEFKNNKGNRKEKIIKSIKKIFRDDYGSWSVAIYDLKEKCLYYFKDEYTSMNLITNKKRDFLYMSTSKKNLKLKSLIDNSLEGKKIETYKLYKFFLEGDKINYKIIASLNEHRKKIKSYYYEAREYKPKHIYRKKNINYALEKLKNDLHIRHMNNSGYCYYCNLTTNNFGDAINNFVCDRCIDEYYEELKKEVQQYNEIMRGMFN